MDGEQKVRHGGQEPKEPRNLAVSNQEPGLAVDLENPTVWVNPGLFFLKVNPIKSGFHSTFGAEWKECSIIKNEKPLLM
jgi:hypothetical protein